MFRPSDVMQPKAQERVLAVLRPHGVSIASKLVGAALLIVLPFLFLFILTTWGVFGWGVIAISLLTGLFLAWRTLRMWDAGVLIVTTHRLIHVDQRGIWARMVREVPMQSVVDVRTERRGMGDVALRVGVLTVSCTSPAPEIRVCLLRKPEAVRELILTARERAIRL